MTKWMLAGGAGVALAGAALAQSTSRPAPASSAAAANPGAIDQNILHVQVILDHLGFSPGTLDGRAGISLTAALKGFQEARGLTITGKIDQPTLAALHPYAAWRPTVRLRLTEAALAGPYVNPIPHSEMEQAKLPALGYRNPLEKLAEMFHTTPDVLIRLNSRETQLTPGTMVVFPNALPQQPRLRHQPEARLAADTGVAECRRGPAAGREKSSSTSPTACSGCWMRPASWSRSSR